MKLILATKLVIGENRQRREFDAKKIQELADSILSKGLLHPPVVRYDAPSDTFRLVAGERRCRAIQLIAQQDVVIFCDDRPCSPGFIPVTLLGDLDELALREAELEENTIRADLSWTERSRALADLDALRREQASLSGEVHNLRTLAAEVHGREVEGGQITAISEALIVAKHLDDPEIAAAKTQKDALKILTKRAEAQKRETLAGIFDMSKTAHTARQGDAFELMKELPDGHFDCILTDPPYGVNADAFGGQAATEHSYKDNEELGARCARLLAREGFRVTKAKAHLYMFLDFKFFSAFRLEFSLAGWTVWPSPFIWYKSNGMLPRPEYGPRRTYECILFASKGDRKVLRVANDVLAYANVSEKDHGAQKPIDLFSDLLSRSCYPGEQVLDPFMGSGTIFPAASKDRLIATGFELNPEYYNLALTRLTHEAPTAPFSLKSLLP
jgi:site-specific DNA-methyltransferase (adenine-specific)